MRSLNGLELRDYIKQRQARQVRGLIQHFKSSPRLAIIQTRNDSVSNLYTKLKETYGEDIGVVVDIHSVEQKVVAELIRQLNYDQAIKGIIVQLPLAEPAQTEQLVNLISPRKDVDSLGDKSAWVAATAVAIDWLLAGYNIKLVGQKIAIVGRGKLVGRPLTKLWRQAGYEVTTLDNDCPDLQPVLVDQDIIVTATGVPGLIKSEMLKSGAVVVDAGSTEQAGKVVGDLDPAVRQRTDLIITPQRGGVGPLTVAALIDNIIRASYPLNQGSKKEETNGTE